MPNQKYSYDSLQQFCLENGVELCKDYNDQIVNRATRIEGKCVTSGCEGVFCKSFREFFENGTYYCRSCLKKVADIKRKQTCLKKYGVQNIMNLDETKDKIKDTSLEKYGLEFPFQSETVKNKIKTTNIERYGYKNPMQNKAVKEKYNKTCLEKYGVEHILQSDVFKEKYKSIILDRFGVENPSQNETIKQKKITTCLQNYGVEYPSQNIEVNNRKKETSFKNYGVEHPMQSPAVLEKNIKNNYKTKPYIFPSGKVIQIQGDETYALDELIYVEQIDENNIITGTGNVPTIWYIGIDGKKHRHYVDIFIPTQNRCIEVKSVWTATKNENNIYLKQNAAKDLGYNYELWIYNAKKQKIDCRH